MTSHPTPGKCPNCAAPMMRHPDGAWRFDLTAALRARIEALTDEELGRVGFGHVWMSRGGADRVGREPDVSDRKYCLGCRDDFYNRDGRQCWLRENAKVVTRYKIGWWTPPTSREAFEEVQTHDCHHAPGQYAFEPELPARFVPDLREEAPHAQP